MATHSHEEVRAHGNCIRDPPHLLTLSEDDGRRYALNRHIYQTLTSMYASIFKTTSPLNLDWRTSEVAKLLGNDADLIRLFSDMKTEMFWFSKSSK
jgi:hypothetical protein